MFWAGPAGAGVGGVALLTCSPPASPACVTRASMLLASLEDVSLITLLPTTSFWHTKLLLASSRGGSARSVFELWQHFEHFLSTARQYHLVVAELQQVVRDHNQAIAHPQASADRQHSIWLPAVAADE